VGSIESSSRSRSVWQWEFPSRLALDCCWRRSSTRYPVGILQRPQLRWPYLRSVRWPHQSSQRKEQRRLIP
jgi:hypothetical protein